MEPLRLLLDRVEQFDPEDEYTIVRVAGWAVESFPARCTIDLELSTEFGSSSLEHWQLLAEGVVSWNCDAHWPAGFGHGEPLLHHVDHPVLWPFEPDEDELYFRGSSEDPAAVVGHLAERHHRETGGWLEIADFVNRLFVGRLRELLHGGHGQFARGPRRLMRAYAEELERGGYAPSSIAGRRSPLTNDDPPVLTAVTLGDAGTATSSGYIIASDFGCTRID